MVLQYSPVQGPTTAQRRRFNERSSEIGVNEVRRAAIATESMLARGAMAALGWMNKAKTQVRGFRPENYMSALQWLREVEAFDLTEARAMLFELAARVGLPRPGENIGHKGVRQ